MAKETKPKLAEAKDGLRKAQGEYEKLIRKSTAAMTGEQREKHHKDCKKALAKKRQARIALEAIRNGRDVPKPEDSKETENLADEKG
jgi:multidrug resistance efflux pump